MDYTARTILKDEQGYYREVDGTRIDTNVNGDVYIQVLREVFDAPIPSDMKAVIESFYPSLGEVNSLRNAFVTSSIVRDDEIVCFRSGLFHSIDGIVGNRVKHASDFEFSMFIKSLAEEDFSNILLENPYKPKEDIG